MKLATTINFNQNCLENIQYNSTIFSLGSCFADNIAQKLDFYKYKKTANPLGIIYNPIALNNFLEWLIDDKIKTELYQNKNCIWSYLFQDFIEVEDLESAQTQIETKRKELQQKLLQSNTLILTFGTAFLFELKENKQIVANCHRQPTELFSKRTLSIQEGTKVLSKTLNKLKELNPNLKIVITVSPIRHIKEGLVNNNLSKSILRLLCEELVSENDFIDYFPAYEIMVDELRDYRFYQKDLIQPNETAIDYIWERFRNIYLEQTPKVWSKIEELNNAMNHRPIFPKSEEHQKFRATYLRKTKETIQQNPELDFTKELQFFSAE